MSAHKSIDKICVIAIVLTLFLTVLFCNAQAFGIETTAHAIGYENRLFDRSKVHTFDIVIDDWDSFLETCESEVYSPCNIVIDGEAVKNVGIRGKGNTSLSSVRNMDSSRFSFKIEFDQYENGKTYHGLDKLCLNNIIQDNTYMKDYLAYTLMYDFGADAPLCSYVYITVNGEDWGLYLAVEAIEESFLERNYGTGYGDLYKPDSLSFGGGGPGNGKDFSMSDFMNKNSDSSEDAEGNEETEGRAGGMPDFGNGEMPDFGNFDFGGEMPDFGDFDFSSGEMPDFGDMPSDFDPSEMFGGDGEKGGFGGFGMGSDDVKLKYTDDEFSSYSNIFNNAKTTVNTADKNRLIASLKALSEQSDLESTLDTEEVLRYFVVHNFLQNGDSYTGQMIHNYYLYEENGQLSMIPWDYNLAYGTFMGGNGSSSVNAAIDTPVSGDMSDRPMVSWIFDNETYTEQYHQLFREFLDSADMEAMIDETAAMIGEYVEKDPTKFCTYEECQKGVSAIRTFCSLREESVRGQLDGTIPSTSDGQKADSSALIDTGDLNTSDMGTMGSGGGFGGGGNPFGRSQRSGGKTDAQGAETEDSGSTERTFHSGRTAQQDTSALTLSNMSSTGFRSLSETPEPSQGRPDFGGQPPEGFDPGNMPEGFDPGNMPEGFDPGNMPEGFDPGNMPEGFEPGNMPEGFDPNNMPEGSGRGERPDAAPSGEEPAQTPDSESDGADSGTQQKPDASEGGQAEKSDRSGSSRPQPGDFPGMGTMQQTDHTAAYILVGVSALFLLFGLGFALRFKR